MAMLSVGVPAARSATPSTAKRTTDSALLALACLASFALSWPHALAVWRTGTFFDPDDAMRMVEVRDWLAGQNWFDLTAHRLAPPSGLLMHWSRVIDLPLGFLVRFFCLFAEPVAAERLARIVFPLLCQVSLILVFAATARVLCGRGARVPALLVIVASGYEYGQFVAGRVDHHAPQIVLLVGMVGSAAAMLRQDGRQAIACATCMAVSLGISLENLPFITTVVVALALAWISQGGSTRPALGSFGVSLALLTTLIYAATVPPSRYDVVANDAFSAPHVLGASLGGGALFGLTRWTWLNATPLRRGCGACIAGLLVGAIVLVLCPGFPADPYANVDPVVKALWLSRVREAMPLGATIMSHPAAATLILAPLVAGLAATFSAGVLAPKDARPAWWLVAAVTAVGLAGALWEVRVASSAMPLAGLGGVWAVTQAARVQTRRPLLRVAGCRIALALLPFTPFAWVLVPMPDDPPAMAQAHAAAQGCRDTEALAPLAGLPAAIAFAPIDVGSHLLAYTNLSVLAAPYHRDSVGNRTVIDGFMAPPDEAEARVRATGARYLVICPGAMQGDSPGPVASNGLAARVLAGDVPGWLDPLYLGETPYRVFALKP